MIKDFNGANLIGSKSQKDTDIMAEALKNHYNKPYIAHVARVMYQVCPSFDKEHFITLVFDDEWEGRGLKDRMQHVGKHHIALIINGVELATDSFLLE